MLQHAEHALQLAVNILNIKARAEVQVCNVVAVVGHKGLAILDAQDRVPAIRRHALHRLLGAVLRDLDRQMERADLVDQLALVHDPDDFLGHRCNNLFAVERAAAALDGVELRVDLVHAVDREVDVVQLVDGEQRDAQLTRLRLGGLGGRDRLDLEAVLDHLAHGVDHMISGGAGAQTDYHAVLDVLGGLVAGQFLHIHYEIPPLTLIP